MSTLPRPSGTPSAAAQRMIKQIIDFATRPASNDPEKNIAHANDLLHVTWATEHTALPLGLAVVNTEGPGFVNLRDLGKALHLNKNTVQRRTSEGHALLEGAA